MNRSEFDFSFIGYIYKFKLASDSCMASIVLHTACQMTLMSLELT